MSESFLVLSSLVYPYFELNIEQDEIHKASLIKQETEFPIYIHDSETGMCVQLELWSLSV